MKWLILRGLVREQRHWGSFPQYFEAYLKKQDPDAVVYTMDFPGFGSESSRASPLSISKMTDDFRARWQTLAPGEAWNVLSMSLGGMVALNWTHRFPDDFKKLVLVNSSVRGVSPFHKRLKPQNYSQILRIMFNSDFVSREKLVLRMTTNLSEEQVATMAKLHAGFALPIRKKDALAQLFAAATFSAPDKLDLPTLVLGSKGDRLVDASCSEAIAKRLGAKAIFHPSANHDLPLDEPEWVSQQVLHWAYQSQN